jgi:hypothetical protein
MDNRDNFEKKIKEKLESVDTPFEEAAWNNFLPLLDSPKTPFWKLWYMPYVYSTVLFGLAFLFYTLQPRPLWPRQNGNDQGAYVVSDTVLRKYTVLRKDTVYIIDTVYVYRKIHVADRGGIYPYNVDLSLNAGAKPGSSFSSNNKIEGALDYQNNTKFDQPDMHNQSDIDLSGIETGRKAQDHEVVSESDSLNLTDLYADRDSTELSASNRQVDETEGIDSSYVAGAGDMNEEIKKKLAKADTTYQKKNPVVKKNKPELQFEAGLSLLIPVSEHIDYYTSFTQAFNIGLQWDNGFGIYLGLVRNNITGEIDDDEIPAMRPSALNAMPGRPDNISTIDEIYLSNRQWYFPLELRWSSMYYSGFSFESSLGLVGNYLVKQGFKYEFENNLGLMDQTETLSMQQFKISHFKLGVGTKYLISDRWGMFLRSHYWLPVSGIGLFENKVHGLEVGVGIHWVIGK